MSTLDILHEVLPFLNTMLWAVLVVMGCMGKYYMNKIEKQGREIINTQHGLDSFKIKVAEEYLKRDDFNDWADRIFAKLDHIETLLHNKADK